MFSELTVILIKSFMDPPRLTDPLPRLSPFRVKVSGDIDRVVATQPGPRPPRAPQSLTSRVSCAS
ncbi:hypothetical protein J6590_042355 [Homalodisca vitripennis]|nr:hypothetical protein J6590_042355 [Homalodisca vitripennis]